MNIVTNKLDLLISSFTMSHSLSPEVLRDPLEHKVLRNFLEFLEK